MVVLDEAAGQFEKIHMLHQSSFAKASEDSLALSLRQSYWRKPAVARRAKAGGDGGIRTLDTLNTYDDLANRCLQPLGHVSSAGAFAVI